MTPPDEPTQDQVERFVIAAHGNLEQVRDLHAQHPELLNLKWQKFDENALEAAGHMGRRDIAGYLLDSGAPLTIYAAAMLGLDDRVSRYLQEDPALARIPGVHGFTVLYHAALSGKTEIAELVWQRGGDLGVSAALHGAVASNHLEMARWLLEHGADVNGLDFQGKTPLRVAEEAGHDDLAVRLTQYGGTM